MRGIRRVLRVMQEWCERRHLLPNSQEAGEYELDNMILSGPEHTLQYFFFEYALCALFSLVAILVTFWFIVSGVEGKESRIHFVFLWYWLRCGMGLHIVNVLLKLCIVRRLYYIPPSDRLIIRRLMLLVRSTVFWWNQRASFVMYNYYVLGLCKLACSNICGGMGDKVYRLCHFVLFLFLLRLANMFLRFLVEYYWLTQNIHFDSIIDQGLSPEQIADLPTTLYSIGHLSGALFRNDWCGICLEYFQVGEEIKKLPCSNQHYFHRSCADAWLRKSTICPYCRENIRKRKSDQRSLTH
jgi:hypothetical protein